MEHLLVLGDSHVQYFNFAATQGLFEPFNYQSCRVTGTTAAGLTNPNSFTAARPLFLSFLEQWPKDSHVVLHLGEVDCGILVWVRSQKNGTPVEIEIERSVESYMHFVDELLASGRTRIILTSATVPTINDNDHAGEIISMRRKAVSASQRERTDVTIRFNERLASEAERRRLVFADARNEVIDPISGLGYAKYRNKNPRDHHMDNLRAGVMWAAQLNKVLDQKRLGAMQHFTATADTLIKSTPLHSNKQPGEHLVRCPAGTRLSGRLAKASKGSTILADVTSPDVAISAHHRIIFADHWKSGSTFSAELAA